MEDRTSLPEEISAELQLALPKLAKQIVGRHREYVRLGSALKEYGFVTKLRSRHQRRKMQISGVSSQTKSVPLDFYHLFGISATHQPVVFKVNEIQAEREDSTLKLEVVGSVAKRRRILWKRIEVSLDVLSRAIRSDSDLILVDFPLAISRGMETLLDSSDLTNEWNSLLLAYESFWDLNKPYIFPFKSDGPMVLSLTQKLSPGFIKSFFDKIRPLLSSEVSSSLYTSSIDHVHLIHSMLNRASFTNPIRIDGSIQKARRRKKILTDLDFTVTFFRSKMNSNLFQVIAPGQPELWEKDNLRKSLELTSSTILPEVNSDLPFPLLLARQKSKLPKDILLHARRRIQQEMVGRNNEQRE